MFYNINYTTILFFVKSIVSTRITILYKVYWSIIFTSPYCLTTFDIPAYQFQPA